MADKTKISWTATPAPDGTETEGATWNVVQGCSHVSEGCRHCYAETLALRYKWPGTDGQPMTPWTAQDAEHNVVLRPTRLREPLRWKQPRRIFVNSTSDLFHEQIPFSYLDRVWAIMEQATQHTYMILTKRPLQALGYWLHRQNDLGEEAISSHIWIGVSVENRKALDRVDPLALIPCAVHFLSLEPLLEDLGQLDLRGIEWVIVGGESGARHRPMDHAWARSIRDACARDGIPFFFKQSSAYRPGTGTYLQETDGSSREWRQWPAGPDHHQTALPGQGWRRGELLAIPLTGAII